MKNKQRKGYRSRPLKSIAIVLLILIIVVGVSSLLISRLHQKAVSGTIKTTNTPSNSNSASGNSASSPKATTTPDKSSSGDQNNMNGGSLITPYGSFVSNHKPGQNGSNLTELSQCITSPGATCYIKFTQNGVVKSLPEKTADSSGSIFWEWNINDAGLTSGTWTITSIASLNGQTKSTTDQLTLQVQ
ncbi:MAG TPA: hypothetical protein VIH90_02405 [Candidatus Saccharimonadales bacterium]